LRKDRRFWRKRLKRLLKNRDLGIEKKDQRNKGSKDQRIIAEYPPFKKGVRGLLRRI
jgi:hypothetical protein